MTALIEPVRPAAATGGGADAGAVVAAARAAQRAWADEPLRRRLAAVRRLRQALANQCDTIAAELTGAHPLRGNPAETLLAEVLPLLDACRFLEKRAGRLLASRRVGARGRPLWLWGVTGRVERVPLGVVLVIGPSNYPLLLPGVQAVQALAAGNAVVVKPGRDGAAAMGLLRERAIEAGVPAAAFAVLDESADAAEAAIGAGVDHVVLTGSARSGRAVLRQCAETLTPATMELSGSDAVFVLPGADVKMAVRALVMGLRLNGSATCIAPRRVLAVGAAGDELRGALVAAIGAMPRVAVDPVAAERAWRLLQASGGEVLAGGPPRGGRMPPTLVANVPEAAALLREDVFAPVCSLLAAPTVDEALRRSAASPFGLGASIFGPVRDAEALAPRLDVGCVTINDLIVPTADPRVPFGGRGESGFGVTRGAEGLLAMTRPRVVLRSGGSTRPHYDPLREDDAATFGAYVRWAHGGGGPGALASFLRGLMRRR